MLGNIKSGEMKKGKDRRLLIAGGLLVVMALAQVWVSNRLVTRGVEMSAIMKDLAVVSKENLEMKQDLLGRTGLPAIASEVRGRGFLDLASSRVVVGGEAGAVAERLGAEKGLEGPVGGI